MHSQVSVHCTEKCQEASRTFLSELHLLGRIQAIERRGHLKAVLKVTQGVEAGHRPRLSELVVFFYQRRNIVLKLWVLSGFIVTKHVSFRHKDKARVMHSNVQTMCSVLEVWKPCDLT